MIFQKRFNELLKISNKKQTDCAKFCGIDKSCITQYKKGQTQPTLTVLFNLCKFFDVSADYLLGLADY